jgi:hypothetical protein
MNGNKTLEAKEEKESHRSVIEEPLHGLAVAGGDDGARPVLLGHAAQHQELLGTYPPTWGRCYDFLNIFAEKFCEKTQKRQFFASSSQKKKKRKNWRF